jgi:excisionase family DNA binding protein
MNRGFQTAHGIQNPLGKRLYTLKEAATYLGRPVWGVRQLIWDGSLPVVKSQHGRKLYLDIKDLDDFINANKATYH